MWTKIQSWIKKQSERSTELRPGKDISAPFENMKREEFIKLAPKCGYGSEERARDYVDEIPKEDYDTDDFIKLYHKPASSMRWKGIRATKGLYEMYGINGRTTAMRNGVAGNDSTRQDWGM